MKRLIAVLATLMAVGGAALLGTGLAQDQLPEHPHLLVLAVEFDGEEPIGFRRCVELAAGRALPLNAHHDHAHFGTAGAALSARAGHFVVPAAPFPGVPWSNCAELEAFFFPN